MNDLVATVLGLTKDWAGLKRYGPPMKKYKGRRRERDDGEEAGQRSGRTVKENTERKDETGGFEITV